MSVLLRDAADAKRSELSARAERLDAQLERAGARVAAADVYLAEREALVFGLPLQDEIVPLF